MKRVLILVLSTEMSGVQGNGPAYHYRTLAELSRATWDREDVDGVETIFYFGRTGKEATFKILYTAAEDEGLQNMGHKTIAALRYAIANRKFDYIFLANSSLYVNKAKLLAYVQEQPNWGLAQGVCAPEGEFHFLWGPARLLSRDVVEAVVAHRDLWNHALMDDNALSRVLREIGIPLDCAGSMTSVALTPDGRYDLLAYENGHGGGMTVPDLKSVPVNLPNQFCFRVKTDANRSNDLRFMKELDEAFKCSIQ